MAILLDVPFYRRGYFSIREACIHLDLDRTVVSFHVPDLGEDFLDDGREIFRCPSFIQMLGEIEPPRRSGLWLGHGKGRSSTHDSLLPNCILDTYDEVVLWDTGDLLIEGQSDKIPMLINSIGERKVLVGRDSFSDRLCQHLKILQLREFGIRVACIPQRFDLNVVGTFPEEMRLQDFLQHGRGEMGNFVLPHQEE